MFKLNQALSSCLLATLITSFTGLLGAQANGNNVQSLGQMPCQEIEDVDHQNISRDTAVGYEIFRAVGRLYTGGTTISARKTGAIACRLTGAGERPTYRTLNLAFGISDDNLYARDSTVRLSVYLDGSFYQYQDVTRGQKYLWPIDITNARSIALEPECIRAGSESSSGNSCPELILFEDTLEQ